MPTGRGRCDASGSSSPHRRLSETGVCVNVDLVVVGSGLFGLTVAERCANDLGLKVLDPRPTPPRRRQRLQRARAGDRHRGAPVRRAPVPHLQRAGVGVRQPLHRRSPATSTGSSPSTRARSTPFPMNLALINQFFGQSYTPERGPRAGRQAGQRDRHRRRHEPRGEGDLADRPPALRGVRQGLHRQAVADRPEGARGRDHHPAAGPLRLQQPLLQRQVRRAAGRRLHRLARADGRPPQHRGAAQHRLLRRARRVRRQGPDRLHRPARRVLRQLRGRAVVAHRRPRGLGASRSATSRAPR